jgi:hypothetical protein
LEARQAELGFPFSGGDPLKQLETIADEPRRGNDARAKFQAFDATLEKARRTLKG